MGSDGRSTPGGRKQRARSRHSKAGCLTCKTRHIKCDERKPTCLKCEKAGWTCEGYQSHTDNANCRSAPRKLVWQPRSTFPFPRTVHVSTIPERFRNEDEYRYFKHFQDSIVIELSGFFDGKLWGSLVLQTCDAETSIRHAATAIGAWNYYSNGWEGTKQQLLGRHFAYRQYSKAIEQTMKATQTETQSLRTNLVACLLFAYFESLNENDSAAYSQLSAGIKLIEEWHVSYSPGPEQNKTSPRKHPVKSPNKWVIEEEILDTFEHAELQANTHCGSKPGPPRYSRAFPTVKLDPLPATFTSLQEARRYLNAIRRKCLFWTRGIYFTNKSKGLTIHEGPKNGLPYDDNMLSEYTRMCSENQDIISIFEQWERSFKPLWEQSQNSESLETYLGSTSLRLHFLNIYLRQWTCTGDESIYYGRFTPELTEILQLSAIIIHYCPTYSKRFTFSTDGQVIMPLDTVACCFRERELRQKAIDMLSQTTRIEGMWRGDLVAKAMQFIQQLEETGLPDEMKFVPKERVVKDLTWIISPENRSTTVCCSQAVDEKWIHRELVVPWDD